MQGRNHARSVQGSLYHSGDEQRNRSPVCRCARWHTQRRVVSEWRHLQTGYNKLAPTRDRVPGPHESSDLGSDGNATNGAFHRQKGGDTDDGTFAALPQAFFDSIDACGLSHLEHRVLINAARLSAHHKNHLTVRRAVTCSSWWLSRISGDASHGMVRTARRRLVNAGIIDETPPELAAFTQPSLSVCGDYGNWRRVRRSPTK
jgi:hypothetical protein